MIVRNIFILLESNITIDVKCKKPVESLTSDRSVHLKTIGKKILSFVIILLKICPGNLFKA